MVDLRSLGLETLPLVIDPSFKATARPIAFDFYPELTREFNGFGGCLLVSRQAFSEPSPHWERNPDGDEMVCLLSGDVDFVLWIVDAETVLGLSRSGAYVVALRGVRHCARPHAPSRMPFVTPGAGSEHGSPHGRAGPDSR